MVAGLNRFLTLLRVLQLYRWRSNRNIIVATRLKGVETTRGEGEGYRLLAPRLSWVSNDRTIESDFVKSASDALGEMTEELDIR